MDGNKLTDNQKEEIRRLAALGYNASDIALYLELSPEARVLFEVSADVVGTAVHTLIHEGVLVSRATPEIKLHEAAEGGNLDAIKQLEEIRKRRAFDNLIDDMDEYE